MAKVPDMKIATLPSGAGTTGGGEATAGDLFAQLLSVMPGIAADPAPAVPGGEIAAEPAGTGAEGEGVELDLPADAAQLVAPAFIPVMIDPQTPPARQPAATVAVDTATAGEAAPPSLPVVVAPSVGKPVLKLKTEASLQPEVQLTATPGEPAQPHVRIAAALKTLLGRSESGAKDPAQPVELTPRIAAPGLPPAPDKPLSRASEPAPAATPAAATMPAANPVFSLFTQPTVLPEALPTPDSGPVETPEQMIERELDLAQDGEWLDRLARDIARSAGSEGPMRFRLNPETLGSLKVEIAQTDRGSAIRFTADTEAARAIIADAQPRLLAEARAQGLRVSETLVDVETSSGQLAGEQGRRDEPREEARVRTSGAGRQARADDEPTTPGERPSARSDRYA